jgi:hypothetical protein
MVYAEGPSLGGDGGFRVAGLDGQSPPGWDSPRANGPSGRVCPGVRASERHFFLAGFTAAVVAAAAKAAAPFGIHHGHSLTPTHPSQVGGQR